MPRGKGALSVEIEKKEMGGERDQCLRFMQEKLFPQTVDWGVKKDTKFLQAAELKF